MCIGASSSPLMGTVLKQNRDWEWVIKNYPKRGDFINTTIDVLLAKPLETGTSDPPNDRQTDLI